MLKSDEEKGSESSPQKFTLLGDKVLVALIRTPAHYGEGELQLFVPSIVREYMNIGVVHSLTDEAYKVCRAQASDVVMVTRGKGQELSEVMVRSLKLDDKRHWMIYKGEDVMALITTDFREIN